MSHPRTKSVTKPQAKAPASMKSPPARVAATKQPVKSRSSPSMPANSVNGPSISRDRSSNASGSVSRPAVSTSSTKASQPLQPQRNGNWLNRTVQNSVAGVGNYAGDFINSIGASVDRIGEAVGDQITNTSRYWGQGVAGYGNNIKDSVGVGGPRKSTGGNALGLAGQGGSQTTRTGAKPVRRVRGKGKGEGSGNNPLGLSG